MITLDSLHVPSLRGCILALEETDTTEAARCLEQAFDWGDDFRYWCDAHDLLLDGVIDPTLLERLKAIHT